MAQFVKTIVELIDDLDGSEGSETLEFGWDGKDYVIDLNEDNATAFREAIAPYLEVARPKPKPPRKSKAAKPVAVKEVSAARIAEIHTKRSEREKRDEIRKWGRRNGFQVSNISRIPVAVVEAYAEAHQSIAHNGRR